MPAASDATIAERLQRLELPFNALGVDPYGISLTHLTTFFSVLAWFYRHYFHVRCHDADFVPARGRAMLIGNHSGGYAVDGGMVLTSMVLEKDPPRLAHGMSDRFLNEVPLFSVWSNRLGQLNGLPEHAQRLLEDERLLMVFPEGNRGTAKLHKERYTLVDFGTGFMRLAMRTHTPIVPVGIVGTADAIPTIYNAYGLGKLVGSPYVPITPYGLALPLPAPVEIHYGEPLRFEGTGNEDDATIRDNVEQVKARVAGLVQAARVARRKRFGVAT